MAYEDDSDFKYVNGYQSVPVTGFDIDENWDEIDDIVPAVETGESKLEGDVNDGNTISASNRHHLHGEAAATWATYMLVLGMKAPDSSTRGDSLDEGEERMQFASAIKAMYYELVDTIKQASGVDSDQGTGQVDFLVADW